MNINEIVSELLVSSQNIDDFNVRAFRGQTEIECSTPTAFVYACECLDAQGWNSQNVVEPQRLLVGVVFDCDIRVVIAIRSLNEWVQRYVNGKDLVPVPELATAINPVTCSDNVSILTKMRNALNEESRWVIAKRL